MWLCIYVTVYCMWRCNIGLILDDRLKETFLKPWKGVLCIHFVCVCVCLSVCGLHSPPFALGTFFLFLIFTLFNGIFLFFPYITIFGHRFSPRNVIFVLREPCTIGNVILLIFLRLKGSFSRFFAIFFNITLVTLVILEISMACNLYHFNFRLFFPTIMLEISTFNFGTTIVQGGRSNF